MNIYPNLFYKNNIKKITLPLLNQLDTLALAVWYCDDGYYDPENHTVQLHTEGYSIKENQIIKDWFNKRWCISVNFKKDPSKKRILLRFPINETDKFLNLIKEHIFDMPQSMWYKLGYLWNGNINRINKAKLNKLRRTKIYHGREEVKVKGRQQAKGFYYRNKEKILKQKAEYRKTEKYKEYIKNYLRRPDVKERMKEQQRKYKQKPENKKKFLIYQREYRKRPKVREKIREYNRRVRKNQQKGGQN